MEATNIAIVVMSSLSALLAMLAWQFDRHIYIPFLRRMKIAPVRQPLFNPHLLPLGLIVVGCSPVFYTVIGWLWVAIS